MTISTISSVPILKPLDIPVKEIQKDNTPSRLAKFVLPLIAAGSLLASGIYGAKTNDWVPALTCLGTVAASWFRGASAPVAKPINPRSLEAFEKIDMLRRVKKGDRQEVLEKLAKLEASPIKETELAALLRSDLSDPIFKNENWIYLAVQAHIEGRIDTMQMAKLSLLNRCNTVWKRDLSPPRIFQLYMFDETGKKVLNNQSISKLFKGMDHLIDAKQLLQVMGSLPPEETQFYSVTVPLLSKEEYIQRVAMGNVDGLNLGFHQLKFKLLLIVDEDGKTIEQLIVPPKLYDGLLKAKFGEQAMMSNPVMGYFKKERMSDPEHRVVCLPSPFAPLPGKIHDVVDATEPLQFYHHDLYHLWVESGNPHREKWIELALGMDDEALRVELLDRHFPLYSRQDLHESETGKRHLTPQGAFWYSFLSLSAKNSGFWTNERIIDVLCYIQERKGEWAAIGITLDSLIQLEKGNPPHLNKLTRWATIAQTVIKCDIEVEPKPV